MKNISFDDLRGKVCVITGGAGVLGTTLSLGLVNAGLNVIILDYNKEACEKCAEYLKKETGKDIPYFVSNVLEKSSMIETKKLINEKHGRVRILINGAGGNSPKATTNLEFLDKENLGELEKSFFGLDVDAFKSVFDLNFIGTLIPSMVIAEDMLEDGGVILNISSMNAFRPLTKIPAYSAAKSSINNFTEWLAVHLAKINIRVNAIAPGFFLTNQNRFLLMDEKTNQLTARGNKIIAGTPMGKFGEPEDLIGTTLYLLSDLSKFVTGVIIPVDGGFNAYSGV
ncbi:MAG: D-mannonate oxidoreductase [Ignavibacteria bacterium RBG_13_36_8]|nr:MAG: D-mannonate oxidoreductase [Ignavibacteria bacterium RBG_13_36_8]